LLGTTNENHQRPQSGELVFCPLIMEAPKYGVRMLTIQLQNANHSTATISQRCVPMTTAMAGEWYTDLWWFRGQQVWHMGTKESYEKTV